MFYNHLWFFIQVLYSAILIHCKQQSQLWIKSPVHHTSFSNFDIELDQFDDVLFFPRKKLLYL